MQHLASGQQQISNVHPLVKQGVVGRDIARQVEVRPCPGAGVPILITALAGRVILAIA